MGQSRAPEASAMGLQRTLVRRAGLIPPTRPDLGENPQHAFGFAFSSSEVPRPVTMCKIQHLRARRMGRAGTARKVHRKLAKLLGVLREPRPWASEANGVATRCTMCFASCSSRAGSG